MRTKPYVHDLATLRRQGFTLIELLIVITIIVVLVAFTMVIAKKIQDKAHQVSALSSIRQVATANASYSMDNNGDINVLMDATDTRAVAPLVSNSFWGRLIPYLFSDATTDDQALLKTILLAKLNDLFGSSDCKTMAKTFQKKSVIKKDGSELPVPFAFNTHVYKLNEYVKTHSFRDPTQTLYMTYGFEYFDEVDGATYAPIPTGADVRVNNIDWFSNRSAAFVFLDGHIETLTPPVAARRFKDPETTP